MRMRIVLIMLILNIIDCSYYIPYKFMRLPIDQSNNSFLIFKYNGIQENRKTNRYILNPVLRYGETYLSPAYNLNPENDFWQIFYSNPTDLPYSMRISGTSQYVYYTEGCEYYIPIPTGEYYIDINFRRVGQAGFVRQKVKIIDQQSLYLNFTEIPDDLHKIMLNLHLRETKPKGSIEKCIYKD
ncbi:hypothetical protein AR546_07130 [Leptospira interrogans serovar Canicola]|nr:hypothetical protein [Leptospira interrogans]ASV10030.1 hypothetical protein B2G50_01185 [Leptospira interrogans serovar Canicola]EKO68777.1 hypothetical protein LEP1GSC069_1536 [Leptospira interrogans serovar Canicola str. Fiocruz LV133]EMJ38264.1 hypothetical protein LEP1GSC079_1177 [Leptospira interrogans str. FPW1039]EMK16907.1 hypothetical protein LEP1GSC075_1671 [Leptospira interrogans str. Kito]EMN53820.1 hypothetical protein LEP1GSC089_1566 [Leptospira interrogans serovar Autumnalis